MEMKFHKKQNFSRLRKNGFRIVFRKNRFYLLKYNGQITNTRYIK